MSASFGTIFGSVPRERALSSDGGGVVKYKLASLYQPDLFAQNYLSRWDFGEPWS
jgi:hypothetical protein